jgi:hypothetical protein
MALPSRFTIVLPCPQYLYYQRLEIKRNIKQKAENIYQCRGDWCTIEKVNQLSEIEDLGPTAYRASE